MTGLTIKQGDKHPVTFTVNHDVTGATIRLVCRHLRRDGEKEVLPHTVVNAAGGVVAHELDGTWAPGNHYIELEITQGGEVRTAPTDGSYQIRVNPDLDGD